MAKRDAFQIHKLERLHKLEGKAPETKVHLVHSGWRSSAEWEEARQWFEKMWSGCFKELSKQVNGWWARKADRAFTVCSAYSND